MSNHTSRSSLARRSFLSRIGTGATAFGAAFGTESVLAQTPAAAAAPWQPARHSEDDWLDQPSAKHRFFIDTTSAPALGLALRYANNFFTANRTGYGLGDQDLAVVIGLRHESTSFAFNDAMWAK